jgi:hypothetical protein
LCGSLGQHSFKKVVDIEGLGEPSRGGTMGDEVAPFMAVRKSPPVGEETL